MVRQRVISRREEFWNALLPGVPVEEEKLLEAIEALIEEDKRKYGDWIEEDEPEPKPLTI